MLLFLYGEDDFRSHEKLTELKNEFLQKNTSDANLSVFDFENENDSDIIGAVNAGGLFSEKKLLIIKNLISSGEKTTQDKLIDFLENKKDLKDDRNTFLIFFEKSEPRKNNKLFKFLLTNSDSQRFEKITDMKLKQWIRQKVENCRKQISDRAADKLVLYVGNDLWRLNNELEKLVNYSINKKIIEQDIELLVKEKNEANIFETIEAITSDNKKRALKFLHKQLERGDDPFYIFSMYVYQFRNLLKVGSFYFEGLIDKYEIAKQAKLHPFVVQKCLAQLPKLSLQQLKTAHKKLEKIDFQTKNGQININLALDKFIMEI